MIKYHFIFLFLFNNIGISFKNVLYKKVDSYKLYLDFCIIMYKQKHSNNQLNVLPQI